MKGKHAATKKKKSKIVILVQIIFIVMLVVSATEIIKWFIDNKKNKDIMKSISESVTVLKDNENEYNNAKYEIDFNKLKQINSDTVAWIKVNNTNIQCPIVKTNNNDYYLTHNFEKEVNKAGWVFMDYKNRLDGTDKNIVVYGHNMRNGSMFGSLLNILTPEWRNNNDNMYITLVTENECAKYQVFSVYQIENEEYYIKTYFEEDEFEDFVNEVTKRSQKNYNVNVTNDDELLTLSTCGNNTKYRVVLHAKKIQ